MHPNLAKLGIHAPGYPGYPGEFLGNSGDFLKSNLRVRKQRGPKQNLKYFYCVQRNLRPQGGSEVNFEILRYVVELDLNFQMLLSLPKTKFPI